MSEKSLETRLDSGNIYAPNTQMQVAAYRLCIREKPGISLHTDAMKTL